MITNSGSQRFDLFKGVFNRNDQFVASPFSNQFLFISDLPFSTANKVLPNLNGNGGSADKRSLLYSRGLEEHEEDLFRRGDVEMRYARWLEEQTKREESLEERASTENLTVGYVTTDVRFFYNSILPPPDAHSWISPAQESVTTFHTPLCLSSPTPVS